MHSFNVNGRQIEVSLGRSAAEIVYVIGESQRAEEIALRLQDSQKTLVFVESKDWNKELSPWEAKPVFGKENFGCGAEAFLKELVGEVIPCVEESTFKPAKRRIVGYSLAGLFALWSLYNCDSFDSVASVSGSLWFDGFVKYAVEGSFIKKPDSVYFSLGNKEKLAKEQRMKTVEKCTEEIYDNVKAQGIRTVFELNEGGHFNDIIGRITKAILFE